MFGLSGMFNSAIQNAMIPRQGIQGVQQQNGAALQHPNAPIGFHQTWSSQNAPMGPQGQHALAPQGQQFANQQALLAQQAAQAAEQKRLADALRNQQGESSQWQQDSGYYVNNS